MKSLGFTEEDRYFSWVVMARHSRRWGTPCPDTPIRSGVPALLGFMFMIYSCTFFPTCQARVSRSSQIIVQLFTPHSLLHSLLWGFAWTRTSDAVACASTRPPSRQPEPTPARPDAVGHAWIPNTCQRECQKRISLRHWAGVLVTQFQMRR